MHVRNKSLIYIALATGCILLIPLIATQLSDEGNWDLFDFVSAGTLLFSAGLTYELVAGKAGAATYRAAVAVAVVTSLALVWVNAAVGIIGDGPVNVMYFGVLAIGIIGGLITRLEPKGMGRPLFAMALAQMAVPVIALVVWNPPFDPGIVPVFALNACFAMLFAGSAFLFRRASATRAQI